MVVLCPAKINLFLAVGPREPSGYHPIRTIFQAVGLFDRLTVERTHGETTVESDSPSVPKENTVTHTLRLLNECLALPPLKIRLEKRIPVQSGLGGGSSDAAGLLRAIQAMHLGQVPETEWHAVAAAVGADVPFFLTGGRAQGEHYGDRITPLEDHAKQWVTILKPRAGCSTAEAYANLDAQTRPWREFPSEPNGFNDFEGVAPQECQALLSEVRKQSPRLACLAGSGSAIVAIWDSCEQAQSCSDGISPVFDGERFVVPTLSRAESLQID